MIQPNQICKIAQSIELPYASTALNVFYWKWHPTGDPNQLLFDDKALEISRDWMQAFYGILAPMLNHNVVVGQGTLYQNLSLPGQPAEWAAVGIFDTDQDGEDASSNQMISHGVAAVMRVAGLAARVLARKYIPGITEAWISASKWVTDALTKLGQATAVWMTTRDITDPEGELVPGTWSTRLNEFVEFSVTGFVSAYSGYQRRRKPGVGM